MSPLKTRAVAAPRWVRYHLGPINYGSLVRRSGVPIVVSAPSGGGKTTLCHRVIAELGGVEFSVSHTTREPRPGERNDVDYHFVHDPDFDKLIKEGAFLEWAHVYDHRYGTSRAQAENRLNHGTDVLF